METDKDKIVIVEPHLPEDFKLIIQQLGMVIEIYHELIMVWAQPACYKIGSRDKEKN